MQGTIVAMAAKMPEVILTEYGLLLNRRIWEQGYDRLAALCC